MSGRLTVSFVLALLFGASHAALAANGCTVTFASTSLVTGNYPRGIATGDFNNDGNLDFAVGYYDVGGNAQSVSVFLGNGDGTFQGRQDYATGTGPVALAVGDVNGDGIPDIVTGNLNAETVSVLLGNGDGTFGAHQDYAAGRWPYGVAIGKFGDAHNMLDIAVANYADKTVGVLLNNGDGTFGTMRTFPAGGLPTSVTAADFNGDGKTDLAVGIKGGSVSVLIGKGQGNFENAGHNVIGRGPAVVVAQDFNGDKATDLATANRKGGVSVLLNNGDGTFAPHADYDVPASGPTAIATGKLNGDQYPDLVTGYWGGRMSFLPGNGDGTFGTAQSFGTNRQPTALVIQPFSSGLATGAFHGEKEHEDVVASTYATTGVIFFKNMGCR